MSKYGSIQAGMELYLDLGGEGGSSLAQQEKRTLVLYINLNLAHEGKKSLSKSFGGLRQKKQKNSIKFSLVVFFIKNYW